MRALNRSSAVRSFARKARRYWVFSGPARAGEQFAKDVWRRIRNPDPTFSVFCTLLEQSSRGAY